ncbi:ATP-binding protein [Deinococcus radiopugnans]|uniref:ATP-binding protein n=1 Tax=Deinococcus radiopugnans TaxID=57497 RepID=UPI0036130E7F
MTALVDNAVKYTRDRERAVIEVWAEDRGADWAVLVRDNGVGFNPQYADKLFTIFQRLHRQEDFGGRREPGERAADRDPARRHHDGPGPAGRGSHLRLDPAQGDALTAGFLRPSPNSEQCCK